MYRELGSIELRILTGWAELGINNASSSMKEGSKLEMSSSILLLKTMETS